MRKKVAFMNHRGYTYPGHLATVVEAMGYDWEMVAREDLGRSVIDPTAYACLFSMGSWTDPDLDNPEVKAEFDLIAAAVRNHVPVVGVCFGAELLALHDGGTVYPLPKPMVGYYPVDLKGSPCKTSHQFFWNSLGFAAPKGAEVLARTSDACLAYRTRYTLALQFHGDASPDLLRSWTAGEVGAKKLREAGVDPARIIREAEAYAPAVVTETRALLESFLAQAGAA